MRRLLADHDNRQHWVCLGCAKKCRHRDGSTCKPMDGSTGCGQEIPLDQKDNHLAMIAEFQERANRVAKTTRPPSKRPSPTRSPSASDREVSDYDEDSHRAVRRDESGRVVIHGR